MKTFKIKVTDRHNEFIAKVYTVEADEEFLAYGQATKEFITENKIAPYQPGKSISAYYARFWNECV